MSSCAGAAPETIIEEPNLSKPAYLKPIIDPTFGTKIIRVSGDPGTPIKTDKGQTLGSWGAGVRPVYSKQAAWNVDGSLLFLYNPGGSPGYVLLNGNTYRPISAGCKMLWDHRWSPVDPSTMIDVDSTGNNLRLINMNTCAIMKSIALPGSTYGIGSGEGNVSNDGTLVGLNKGAKIYAVNISTGGIGPMVDVSACGQKNCAIDFVTVSPSGNYFIVSQNDYQRVFKLDRKTLALTPMNYPKGFHSCSFGPQAQGYLDASLGHADFSFLGKTAEVIVGQGRCPEARRPLQGGGLSASLNMIDLSNGKLTALTIPVVPATKAYEAYADHISARATGLAAGPITVGYYKQDSTNGYKNSFYFSEQILTVAMDGTAKVKPLAFHHSTQSFYASEPHASPNWTNTKYVFGSDWASHCASPCGSTAVVSTFVLEP